jgi:hypothetical protein
MKEKLTAERKRCRLNRTLESYVGQIMKCVLCIVPNGMLVLEASSYARALQGEPVRCFAHFARHKIMTRALPFENYIRVRGLE